MAEKPKAEMSAKEWERYVATKPLWFRFANMTTEETEAEQAEDLRRCQSGEMSEAEADERIAAWDKAARYCKTQAQLLDKAGKLAHATGCPADTPPVRWLIDKGLMREDGTFTDRANGPHPV
jgi:hypothetical protein